MVLVRVELGAEVSPELPESLLQRGGNRDQGWEGWAAHGRKGRPPRSAVPMLTLKDSGGKTMHSFPEKTGHHLIKRESSVGPLIFQNHSAFSAEIIITTAC